MLVTTAQNLTATCSINHLIQLITGQPALCCDHSLHLGHFPLLFLETEFALCDSLEDTLSEICLLTGDHLMADRAEIKQAEKVHFEELVVR